MRSPLLDLARAVPASGVDEGVAAHYGSFVAEQRHLVAGRGFVDLSHRDVVTVSGPDRIEWLHSLTTQDFRALSPGSWTGALVLSPHGHVEHAMYGYDDGEGFVAHCEPGRGAALLGFLESMRFALRVTTELVTDALAVVWRPDEIRAGEPYSGYLILPRADLAGYAESAGPAAGTWAFEALRIERGDPRLGVDTDHRTIPNEMGWLGSAVHLDKGCYRGQETVARVHNLGRPPRRLTRLLLDGSVDRLPVAGAPLLLADRAVGFVGGSARHHEWGPIALALVKRTVPVDATLTADGIPAGQEVIVDPDVGEHFRPPR